MSDVVCHMMNADRVAVRGKKPRDLLSGLMTSMLGKTTARMLNGPTSVKLVGVNNLQGVLSRKRVAYKGVCRVLPFRGSLYMIALGKDMLGRLFTTVTTYGNRKMDKMHLRVAGSNGLLSNAVNNGPVSSGGLCAMTAVSCLTSKGSKVKPLTGTRGESYPPNTALHKLFVGCMRRRAGTNGGVASHVRKEVAIGWL